MISPALVLAAVVVSIAPMKLALPGLQVVGIDPKLGAFYGEHFAQQLTLRGARVTSTSEISALLGLERQKQLLGCSDEASSCMAELAKALGVDGLALGDVAKVG